MASLNTPLAGQGPVAMAINIFPPSSLCQKLPLSQFRTCSHHFKVLPLILYRMRSPRRLSARKYYITSESSSTSPIDTDNDGLFEPDSSETDLTEPESTTPKKLSLSPKAKSLHAAPSNIERVLDNDIDKDLAKVLEDYSRSNQIKKLKLYLKKLTKYKISKEIGEVKGCANKDEQGIRYLVDKRGLDKQPWANIPVYIKDMIPFNEIIL
ncbi:hypothetical protein N7488_008936 [Penicillium malachiteum]|nr:hypothetical protein N7488_008936 [Penicillium malachiteum]